MAGRVGITPSANPSRITTSTSSPGACSIPRTWTPRPVRPSRPIGCRSSATSARWKPAKEASGSTSSSRARRSTTAAADSNASNSSAGQSARAVSLPRYRRIRRFVSRQRADQEPAPLMPRRSRSSRVTKATSRRHCSASRSRRSMSHCRSSERPSSSRCVSNSVARRSRSRVQSSRPPTTPALRASRPQMLSGTWWLSGSQRGAVAKSASRSVRRRPRSVRVSAPRRNRPAVVSSRRRTDEPLKAIPDARSRSWRRRA